MTITLVTGTDTGVGKTIVTAALAARRAVRGAAVVVFKPAQTGVSADEPGDAAAVAALSGVRCLEGTRLTEPLAPVTAARLDGRVLPTLAELVDSIEALITDHLPDQLLIEGAGGVLVELGEGYGLLDVGVELTARGHLVDVVVVARAGLGTLNHTALTARAVTQARLRLAGVVIGSWPENPGLAEHENLTALPEYAGARLVGRVPEGAGKLSAQQFGEAAEAWLTI